MSGNIFGCHILGGWGDGKVLLTSRGYRPRELLNVLQSQDISPHEELCGPIRQQCQR